MALDRRGGCTRRGAWTGEVGRGVSWRFGRGNSGPQTAAVQHVVKGSFKLLAETRVDDGVNAAVEVAQPEGYLKDGFRRLTGREDGSWKRHTKENDKKRKIKRKLFFPLIN